MKNDDAEMVTSLAMSKTASKPRWWGSFAAKWRTLLLFLLVMGLLPAFYAVLQTQSALHSDEKANGAHNVLERYLELSAIGFAIEKKMAADGSLENAEGRKLLAQKNAIASQLRRGIAAEIAMRGEGGMEEEGVELDHTNAVLSALDKEINGAVDTGWTKMIDEAIAEERREMAEIDLSEKFAMKSTIFVLTVSSAIVFVLYIFALVWLDRSIGIPLTKLRRATNRVAEGAKNVRLPPMRDAEFETLAENFNLMAQALDNRRATFENNAADLEQLVSARTVDLRALNSELVSVSNNRKQFLTDISHELRTPLAIIRGDAEVTLRGEEKPAEEYQAALARIAAQISGLTRLVDDLLYVARNEDAAPSVQLRPVELVSIIKQAADSMRPLLEDVAGQLIVTSDVDAARIVGDDQRLTQLAFILLDNAVQYSDGTPDITVELLHATDGYMLQVRDKGIGIAANDLPTVFDRFRRGREGMVKNDIGLGIGLPMAKAIVEAHGGKISIASNLGEGTTVTAFLPAAQNLRVVNEYIGG